MFDQEIDHDVKNVIKKLKMDLINIEKQNKSIIFIGVTGSGKGTLIHYLLKNIKLYAQISQNGEILIKLKNNIIRNSQFPTTQAQKLSKILISNRMSSETSIPSFIEHKNQILVDLPGFMDNRNQKNLITQDLINQFYIQQIFKKTQNIKMVFVVSKNSLSDRGIQFIQNLNYFVQHFNSKELIQLKKSIFLVVSKVPGYFQVKNVKFILNCILNDLNKQIPQNSKQLLREWIQKQNKIQLFKLPEKQGTLYFKNSQIIYEKLKKIPYSKIPSIKNVISLISQQKINKIKQKYNQSINKICSDYIQFNYEEYLKSIKKIKILNRTKIYLNNLRHHVDQLINSQNVQDFRLKFRSMPTLLKDNKQIITLNALFLTKFQQNYQILRFFYKIQPQIINLDKWKQNLYKIHHKLSLITSEPWSQIYNNEQDIYIKGFIVNSETLQRIISNIINTKIGSTDTIYESYGKINYQSSKNSEFLNNNFMRKRRIIVFAYFFIMNSNIEFTGIDMMIFTQYYSVDQKKYAIKLNGQNGKNHAQSQAQESAHGMPGRPGKNGGNLFLKIYQNCQNLNNLNIQLKGGSGGKGQDGGQLKNLISNKYYIEQLRRDTKVPTKNKKYLRVRQQHKFSQRNMISKIGQILRMLGTYNSQVLEYYSTQNQIEDNIKNLKAFKYTKGGAGGYPGYSGNLHLDLGFNFSDKNKISFQDKPQPSNHGQSYVQVYQGYYLKQMIFPNFRQQGKQLNVQKTRQEYRINVEKAKIEQQKNKVLLKNVQIQKSPQKSNDKSQKNESQHLPQKNKKIDHLQLVSMILQLKQKIHKQQLKTPLKFEKKYLKKCEQKTQLKNKNLNITDQQSIENYYNRMQTSSPVFKNLSIRLSHNQSLRQTIKKTNQLSFIFNKKPLSKKLINESYYKQLNFNEQKLKSKPKKNNKQIEETVNNSQNNEQKEKLRQSHYKILKNVLDKFVDNLQNYQCIDANIKPKQFFSQIGKQVATDIGTGAVQKLTQRFINIACQKIIRSGMTVQKQVLKQFIQNAALMETEKNIIKNIGRVSGQTLISKQISKMATKKIQQALLTGYGKQVIKDGAIVLQKQAFKHLTQDIAKEGLKTYGKEALTQAQLQITATSLTSGQNYLNGMLKSLGQSILFQLVLSIALSSGITDGWIVKPHVFSKKVNLVDKYKYLIQNTQNNKKINVQNYCLNYIGIQQPQPFEDFTQIQIKIVQSEYQYFLNAFKQLKNFFIYKN